MIKRIIAGAVISALMLTVMSATRLPLSLYLAMTWLCVFFPADAVLILGTGSFAAFFFNPRMTGALNFNFHAPDLPGRWAYFTAAHVFEGEFSAWCARVACAIVLLAFTWWALRHRFWQRYALRLSFALLFSFALAFEALRGFQNYAAYLALTLLILWIKFMWSSLLIIRLGLNRPDFPLRQMWMIFPPWNVDGIPLWSPQRLDRGPRPDNFLKVLAIAALLAAVIYVDRLIYRELFAPFPIGRGWPRFADVGIIPFLENIESVLAAWVVVLWMLGRFIFMGLGVVMSLPILLLMVADFPAVLTVDAPHRARTFHEFCSRIMRFYVQIIVVVLYTPVASSLRFLRARRRLRTFCATFLSVFILGVAYHFFRYTYAIANNGLLTTAGLYFSTAAVYICIMAGLSALSVTWAESRVVENRAVHGLRLGLIFVVYALVMSLAYNPHAEAWVDRWRLFAFLFTGERGS